MSIETLLEAAKFLELQALHQQKTREEKELRETLRLEQEAGKRRAEVASYVQRARGSHVASAEGWSSAHRHTSAPVPAPPPPPPPPPPLPAHAIPITVIPVPVVSPSPAPTPTPPTNAIGSPPPARLTPPRKDARSSPAHHALQQSALQSNQAKAPPSSPALSNGAPPLQPYPGPVVATSQHALLPQGAPSPAELSPSAKNGPFDDRRSPDSKKRPGGRAHLKECFETLKKNIPSVDEKKTSNLSLLRSALRCIQTLKRKEKEFEHEMERLAREKISMQQRLADLKNELGQWMDVLEMDRVLRPTVQPEDDQASTSTASEGEDNMNEEDEQEGSAVSCPQPRTSRVPPPESRTPRTVPHASIPIDPLQPALPPAPAAQPGPPSAPGQPSAPSPSPAPLLPRTVAPPSTGLQPSVIAHATSHASVIQAISHAAPPGVKHAIHAAPSPSGPARPLHGPLPVGHIAVHPLAHLGQPLPALYPQPVAVTTQPAVVSHVAHALSHGHVNGAAPPSAQSAALVAKQPTQVLSHHPQLVGQTVLNPVTMVTMPSFPLSTLKLA